MQVLFYSYYYHCFGRTKANAEEVSQEREMSKKYQLGERTAQI